MNSDFGSDIFQEHPEATGKPGSGGEDAAADEASPKPRPRRARGSRRASTTDAPSDDAASGTVDDTVGGGARDTEDTAGDSATGGDLAGDGGQPTHTKSKRGSRKKKSRSRSDEKIAADDAAGAEDRPGEVARIDGPESDREDRGDSRERDEPRGRKRGSRRRGRDRDRDERRPPRDRDERRTPRDHSARRNSRDDKSSGLPLRQRIAILVDASEVRSRADSSGNEISFGHMRRHIAGTRSPIRALAYIGSGDESLAPNLNQGGFEPVALDEKSPSSVAIAVDAMAIADRVDCIVLVPGSPELHHLARVLRDRGVRVETASFAEEDDSGVAAQHHHVLGEESSFKV